MEYDPDAWERLGDGFTNNYEQGVLDFRQNIIDTVIGRRSKYGNSLLELACADGWFIQQLRKRHYGGMYLGIDITPGLIARARGRCPHEAFEIQDARNIGWDIPSGCWEFVLCAGLLMHIDRPVDVIHECCRLSSKYIMISTYGTHGLPKCLVDTRNRFLNNYYSFGFINSAVESSGCNFNLIEFKSFPRRFEYMFQFLYERVQ